LEAGKLYGINPGLLQSIARVESRLDSKAMNFNKNGSADFGLMQINSAWIDTLQLDKDRLLSDPCYNAMTGAKILKGCIDRWEYTWQAVGCYNATSQGKRIGYSWKIYRELKKESLKNKKIAEKKEHSPGSENAGKSLHFRVRSIEGSEVSGEP
jgi:soluble lytic murein transglycosylase-like protein